MRGYVDTTWGQVHYRSAGFDGPALVLFHESPLSSVIFDRALPLLGESLQVWAFDTPGYGLSDPPETPLEIPAYASRLLAAIEGLGLQQFAVGGVHTGASIAVEVARQAGSARVTKAVLTGIPVLEREERDEYLKSWTPPVVLDDNGRHLLWAWRRYREHWGPASSLQLIHLGAMQMLANYERYHWAYRAAFRYDPSPALRELGCAVLLLNADGDSLVFTAARAERLIRSVRSISIPGLRGQLPWRAPEAYAREVVAFIAGGLQSVGSG